MKTKLPLAALLLALGTFNSQLSTVHAQGALTPPGAPAPTMKSLAQIEPRTDVLTLPTGTYGAYSITQPGSYYLSANIVGAPGVSGIEIKTNDVTVDLRGFALTGAGGIRGIFANGNNLQRITVRNGKITGYSFGIDCGGVLGTNHSVIVEDVQLVGFSGTGGVGLTAGNGLQVRRVQISNFNGLGGAALTAGNTAQLTDLLAQNNYAGIATGSNSVLHAVVARSQPNNYAISVGSESQLSDCESIANGQNGFDAAANCSLTHCLARKNGLAGIFAGFNAIVTACSTMDNSGIGIATDQNSLIRDCLANHNGDTGISTYASSIQNCLVSSNAVRGIVAGGLVSGCSVWANQSTGIFVSGPNGKVINNQCDANGTLFDAGIYINGPGYHVEGNTVTGQTGTGILVNGGNPNCFVVANKAHGNGTNYFFVPLTTTFGTVITLSGGGITNGVGAWANFSY